jgi:hypothetical protein
MYSHVQRTCFTTVLTVLPDAATAAAPAFTFPVAEAALFRLGVPGRTAPLAGGGVEDLAGVEGLAAALADPATTLPVDEREGAAWTLPVPALTLPVPAVTLPVPPTAGVAAREG